MKRNSRRLSGWIIVAVIALSVGMIGAADRLPPEGPLAQFYERGAQIALGCGPTEWYTLAGPLLQRQSEGGHGLPQSRGSGFPLGEIYECEAEVVLGSGPIERHTLA